MSKSNRVMTFSVGDRVTWKSQAGGHTKTKTGTVIEVVPANKYPKHKNFGSMRKVESYIVEVTFPAKRSTSAIKKTTQRKPEVYWPLVGNLRLVKRGGLSAKPSAPVDAIPTNTVVGDNPDDIGDPHEVGAYQQHTDFDTTDVSSEERPIADLESLPDDDQPMQVDAADEHSADDPYPAAVVNAIEGGGDPSNVESSAN